MSKNFNEKCSIDFVSDDNFDDTLWFANIS